MTTPTPLEFDASPLPHLAPRDPQSHKGNYGRALLIGGSCGMAGAIGLAGISALRGGAGLVRLAVPTSVADVVAGFEPSYMTTALPADRDGRLNMASRLPLLELAPSATALACGPGLGRSDELNQLVASLYAEIKQPVVFDADALNALAKSSRQLGKCGGPRVLTPHPAEFARLLGLSTEEAQANRDRLAMRMAKELGIVLIVKGHRSLITDGCRAALNETGNPGMATGGSGDVLTGLITALLCQGLPPYEAARLGAYLHGLAGDLAAAELGQVGLIASDLCRFLPRAFLRHAQAAGGSTRNVRHSHESTAGH